MLGKGLGGARKSGTRVYPQSVKMGQDEQGSGAFIGQLCETRLRYNDATAEQQFSDDEGDVNEPLAPLPDEPEVVEGDEDVEQEDASQSVQPDPASRDMSEPIIPKDELPSKVSSPKPHPLSISFQPPLASEQVDDGLDNPLQGLGDDLTDTVDVGNTLGTTDLVDLDLSQLGPDGTGFEATGDLTEMDPGDILVAGDILDTDPFAMQSS